MLGISAILQEDAVGYSPCGCGECEEKLEVDLSLGHKIDSDWIVHFLVPAKKFWDNIGFT